jgi:hypothetical protein
MENLESNCKSNNNGRRQVGERLAIWQTHPSNAHYFAGKIFPFYFFFKRRKEKGNRCQQSERKTSRHIAFSLPPLCLSLPLCLPIFTDLQSPSSFLPSGPSHYHSLAVSGCFLPKSAFSSALCFVFGIPNAIMFALFLWRSWGVCFALWRLFRIMPSPLPEFPAIFLCQQIRWESSSFSLLPQFLHLRCFFFLVYFIFLSFLSLSSFYQCCIFISTFLVSQVTSVAGKKTEFTLGVF